MWQVAVCEPGRTVRAGELLKADGYEVFVPLMREHKKVRTSGGHLTVNSVERPLFGPYLFIEWDGWGRVCGRYIVRVLDGVGGGEGVVPQKVMESLIEAADPDGVIVGRDLPRVKNGRCIDFVAQPGDLCNVTVSLQQLIGVIYDVSKVERTGFLDVLVEILGRQCKVNLHYTQVQVITRKPPAGVNRRVRRNTCRAEPA